MDFIVKEAAMSLEIEIETWLYLVYCSFCSKIFHSNVSKESPDNSKRSDTYYILVLFSIIPLPPIIKTPFSVGENIIVDPYMANGSLGPKVFIRYICFTT